MIEDEIMTQLREETKRSNNQQIAIIGGMFTILLLLFAFVGNRFESRLSRTEERGNLTDVAMARFESEQRAHTQQLDLLQKGMAAAQENYFRMATEITQLRADSSAGLKVMEGIQIRVRELADFLRSNSELKNKVLDFSEPSDRRLRQ